MQEPPAIKLVDTHAHLHFDVYRAKIDAVLSQGEAAGVSRFITVGVNTADSRAAVDLAATYGSVWAAVGIHPHDAGEAEQGMGYLRELAARRKVVAIGECGLDLYRSTTSLEQQRAALKAQIELALELGLPLIFHVREAFEPFFELLEDYTGLRGVVHSFTGNRGQMEAGVAAGLHIALNGIVTFNKDAGLRDAAKAVPAERLVLETDCPFLSPAPHRGKENEPARVADIAAFVAQLRDEPVKRLAAQTTANAEQLFKLV